MPKKLLWAVVAVTALSVLYYLSLNSFPDKQDFSKLLLKIKLAGSQQENPAVTLTENSTVKNISPDYDYFVAYKQDSLNNKREMASIITEVLTVENTKITLLVKGSDPIEIEISDPNLIYAFKKGDKENFFKGSYEDIKVGSVVTYYFPLESASGNLYVRLE